MAATIEELAEQAMSLPTEARARLADLLVESLDADESDLSIVCGWQRRSEDGTTSEAGAFDQSPVTRRSNRFVTPFPSEMGISSGGASGIPRGRPLLCRT